MLAVLWDNDPQRDTEAGLWQYPLGANSETRHTTITTSGSTSGWQFFNNAGLSVVVDNESSSYFIVVCTSDFGRQGSVQAVQLFYTN